MTFDKIPANYMIICDTSIMFVGSKKNCLKYYNSLPDPVTMYIVRIESKRELRRR